MYYSKIIFQWSYKSQYINYTLFSVTLEYWEKEILADTIDFSADIFTNLNFSCKNVLGKKEIYYLAVLVKKHIRSVTSNFPLYL